MNLVNTDKYQDVNEIKSKLGLSIHAFNLHFLQSEQLFKHIKRISIDACLTKVNGKDGHNYTMIAFNKVAELETKQRNCLLTLHGRTIQFTGSPNKALLALQERLGLRCDNRLLNMSSNAIGETNHSQQLFEQAIQINDCEQLYYQFYANSIIIDHKQQQINLIALKHIDDQHQPSYYDDIHTLQLLIEAIAQQRLAA